MPELEDDFDFDDDFSDVFIPHRIRCSSGWPACPGSHETVGQVKACYEAAATPDAWPCTWLMEGRYDDMSIFTYDCGAATTYTENERGVRDGRYECTRGHNHIPMEIMAAQGMAYASDDDEAIQLRRVGVQPLEMSGGVYH
jgi:hypothetical protein